ncbi:hypothetical protein OSB04_017783 [Centaurea solstitialis]|uniref:Uncharacterized protein n=1 Tax=Centaurea solstitialis TaxID=347529 RepID=A0AA38T3J1_9ASTR|nr:hypothetical protein OSB04_017783 [Centaurea solstitialis]
MEPNNLQHDIAMEPAVGRVFLAFGCSLSVRKGVDGTKREDTDDRLYNSLLFGIKVDLVKIIIQFVNVFHSDHIPDVAFLLDLSVRQLQDLQD